MATHAIERNIPTPTNPSMRMMMEQAGYWADDNSGRCPSQSPLPFSLGINSVSSGEDDGYGRLKGDDSIPRDYDFDEHKPKRGLADRISRETEGINIRGQGSSTGINIRGVANAS